MGINSHISIRIFDESNKNYNEVNLNGQDNSIASIFLDPIISNTNIKFDINEVLTDNEVKTINMKDINEYTICSDIISASVLQEIMLKIFNLLFVFGGIASEILEMDLREIDSLSIDEKSKKSNRMNDITCYMLFADTFGKLSGILEVAKSLNSNVQIIVIYG